MDKEQRRFYVHKMLCGFIGQFMLQNSAEELVKAIKGDLRERLLGLQPTYRQVTEELKRNSESLRRKYGREKERHDMLDQENDDCFAHKSLITRPN